MSPTPQRPARKFLRGLRVQRVDIVPRGDDPEARIVIAKAHPEADTMDTLPEHLAPLAELDADTVAAIGTYVDDLANLAGEQAEALAKAQAEAADLAAQLAKAQEDAEPTPDPLAKADPAVRELVEKAQADAAAAIAKAEQVEAERRAEVFKARAAALPRLFSEGTGGDLLAKAATALGDDYDELEQVLVAADERLAKSDLLKEMGAGQGPAPDSALAEVHKRAEAAREADPQLTKADAITSVLKADPDLYDRYNAERTTA